MPPWAYPIIIQRDRQRINYTETKRISASNLFLDDLIFVGDNGFEIDRSEFDSDDWTITVYRHRLETGEERDRRVAEEEAYMTEYNRRHHK